jgi:nitrite reductase/ring-hydroxylating ferredoxin subunit
MTDRSAAGAPIPSSAPCGGWQALASRRDFLREAASLAACSVALGVVPGRSLEFPIRLAAALRIVDGEAVYPIPREDGATIDRDHEVILARYQDRVYAFGLSCPHQRTALRWQEEERRFQCPKHKSTFQLDGAFLAGRATRSMDRYALRREGDTVVVDLSTLLQEDKDRDRWVEAVVQL